MTEAAAIVSAVDGDPSLREALQSLIRSMGWHVAPLAWTPEVLTGNRPNALYGSVENCHAPSISGILAYIIEEAKGSTVGGKGEQGRMPAPQYDALAPESAVAGTPCASSQHWRQIQQ